MQTTIFALRITELAIKILIAIVALICHIIKIAAIRQQLNKDLTSSTPQTNNSKVNKIDDEFCNASNDNIEE